MKTKIMCISRCTQFPDLDMMLMKSFWLFIKRQKSHNDRKDQSRYGVSMTRWSKVWQTIFELIESDNSIANCWSEELYLWGENSPFGEGL